MKIKTNDLVLVKLTPSGKTKLLNALADQAQEINRSKEFGKQYTAQDFMPAENSDGEVRMTFWEVASLLFRDSYNGSALPVEYLKTLEGPDSQELLKATVSTLVHNAHNEVSSWIYGMDADIGGGALGRSARLGCITVCNRILAEVGAPLLDPAPESTAPEEGPANEAVGEEV